MADYYPLLARAISALPANTPDARRAVYERARTALLAQLRGADPPLPEEDVERERRSLEEALRRVEAENAPPSAPATSAPATPAPPAAPAPPAFGASARPSGEWRADPGITSARELPQTRELPAAPSQPPQAEKTGFIRSGLTPPRDARPAPADESSLDAPLDGGAATDRQHGGFIPPARDADDPETSEDAGWELPDPDDVEARRRRLVRLVLALVAVLVLGGAAAIGYMQREPIIAAILELRGADAPVKNGAATPAKPEQTKSTDRVAQAPSDPARRPAPQSAAPTGQTAAVAQRAVLFEENPGGGQQGLQQFVGTVVWRTDSFDPGNGLGPDIGIRATIEIPDRQLKVNLSLRRNQDASLPASHIIELQFDLPANFDLGSIANVPGMRAKATEAAQGLPLSGLAVRVTPGFFLIGLSALDAERQRNLGLLITRNWLDVPIVFGNGRRGILAIEKGLPGDQAFREAFSAWGLPLPPQNPPGQQQP